MADDEIADDHEPGDHDEETAQEPAAGNGSAKSKTRRRRKQRTFPISSFKQASELAEAMLEIGGGAREVRRVTLFDHLERSPESGPSRQAVTNSARYGLTEGSYQAETLALTDNGLKAVNPDASPRECARAQYKLAIEGIAPFNALYERFAGNKLPAQQVMRDFLTGEQDMSEEDAKEAVELFILNAREIGLIQTMSGAERILTLDHMLDELPAAGAAPPRVEVDGAGAAGAVAPVQRVRPVATGDLQKTCFYVTPRSLSSRMRHLDYGISERRAPRRWAC